MTTKKLAFFFPAVIVFHDAPEYVLKGRFEYGGKVFYQVQGREYWSCSKTKKLRYTEYGPEAIPHFYIEHGDNIIRLGGIINRERFEALYAENNGFEYAIETYSKYLADPDLYAADRAKILEKQKAENERVAAQKAEKKAAEVQLFKQGYREGAWTPWNIVESIASEHNISIHPRTLGFARKYVQSVNCKLSIELTQIKKYPSGLLMALMELNQALGLPIVPLTESAA